MTFAIKVEGLSKRYKLGVTHVGSLREAANCVATAIIRRRHRSAAINILPEHADRVDEAGYFWALKDISLEIPQGEVVGVIGKNGAGKSTLLKLLSRITSPTEGRIRYRGRIASLLEVGTGFHPELTGRENVYLNGTILGMTRMEIRRQFDAILDFAGVEKFIDTPVKRYSSGMTVRLGFAVAAHLDSEILIVDEVLAVGDIEFQEKCLGKMHQVSRSGKTVLFVSHNMASVRALTTRAIVISRGELRFMGQTSQAVSRYTDENLKNTASTKDVSKLERPFAGLSREVDIVDLQQSTPVDEAIIEGKSLRFRLTVRANHEHEAFLLGITIYKDDHSPVGTTFSSNFGPVVVGQASTFHVLLPTQLLATGRYHCAISLVEARSNKTRLIDTLTDVLPFEIATAGGGNGKWNPAWGPIRMDETIVTLAE